MKQCIDCIKYGKCERCIYADDKACDDFVKNTNCENCANYDTCDDNENADDCFVEQ